MNGILDSIQSRNVHTGTSIKLTDCSRPSSQVIEAFSLCMFFICLHLLSNSPEWSPFTRYYRGTGSRLVTRPGVFEIRSRNDSNTVPVLVSLMHLLQSPLQVLYTRRSGNAYHRALQTSWRGWADSKAVHSMECIGAHSLYWRTLSQ